MFSFSSCVLCDFVSRDLFSVLLAELVLACRGMLGTGMRDLFSTLFVELVW